jgi:hypothetical protein
VRLGVVRGLVSFVEIAGGAIPFTVDETTLSVILRALAAATVALVLFAWCTITGGALTWTGPS